jgi:MFS family permease
MPYWLRQFSTTGDNKITASQDSLIVSILSAGTFFGALLAAPIADKVGKEPSSPLACYVLNCVKQAVGLVSCSPQVWSSTLA